MKPTDAQIDDMARKTAHAHDPEVPAGLNARIMAALEDEWRREDTVRVIRARRRRAWIAAASVAATVAVVALLRQPEPQLTPEQPIAFSIPLRALHLETELRAPALPAEYAATAADLQRAVTAPLEPSLPFSLQLPVVRLPST